jgi:hypothetical protein
MFHVPNLGDQLRWIFPVVATGVCFFLCLVTARGTQLDHCTVGWCRPDRGPQQQSGVAMVESDSIGPAPHDVAVRGSSVTPVVPHYLDVWFW